MAVQSFGPTLLFLDFVTLVLVDTHFDDAHQRLNDLGFLDSMGDWVRDCRPQLLCDQYVICGGELFWYPFNGGREKRGFKNPPKDRAGCSLITFAGLAHR
jgi:hypothetical protein